MGYIKYKGKGVRQQLSSVYISTHDVNAFKKAFEESNTPIIKSNKHRMKINNANMLDSMWLTSSTEDYKTLEDMGLNILKKNLQMMCFSHLSATLIKVGIDKIYIPNNINNQCAILVSTNYPEDAVTKWFNDAGFDCNITTTKHLLASDDHLVEVRECGAMLESLTRDEKGYHRLMKFDLSDEFWSMNLVAEITASARISLYNMSTRYTNGVHNYNKETGLFEASCLLSNIMCDRLGIILDDGVLTNKPDKNDRFWFTRNLLSVIGFDLIVSQESTYYKRVSITCTSTNPKIKTMSDTLQRSNLEYSAGELIKHYLRTCEPFVEPDIFDSTSDKPDSLKSEDISNNPK